ncbi:hypothetical protein NM688_g8393 [Phlebia brevispora]|uniref:Uncharacterized protein n=1 Tax=Phlebia brevispora TaxID=194682 RepID=A0ACC1RRY7_9APHY|nr:hypothetical protein NM688_g8393 [Phlebia brevispora]
MGGSKRNKVKKLLSPSRALTPPAPDNALNDDDLMDDLLAQLDSRDKASQTEAATVVSEMQPTQVAEQAEAAPKQDSKSRHKARQARKAAALAEKLPPVDADADAKLDREAREEERIINQTCDELGVKMHEINPDGHCLFSAVAEQLAILGVLPPQQATYEATRRAAADYMQKHPDDFIPFIPSVDNSENDNALMSLEEYERYCATIRDTAAWGGEPEILALSKAYNVPIHVIQGATPHIVVHDPSDSTQSHTQKNDKKSDQVVRISYHRRMYGLGEHYNSLRPKRSLTNGIKAIFSSSPP